MVSMTTVSFPILAGDLALAGWGGAGGDCLRGRVPRYQQNDERAIDQAPVPWEGPRHPFPGGDRLQPEGLASGHRPG